MKTVKATLKTRQGMIPVQYRQNADGSFSRMNRKGRWVTLNPMYAEHQNALKAAKYALR